MPLYEYVAETGEVIERLLPADSAPPMFEEGGRVYHRKQVLPFAPVGLKPAPSMGAEVLRGYHAEECKRGARFRSRLHHETIKRAWANDTPD